MKGVKRKKTGRSPAVLIVTAGIFAVALLAVTVQAADTDTMNTLSGMTKTRLGLVSRTGGCGNATVPPMNTEEIANALMLVDVIAQSTGGESILPGAVCDAEHRIFECAWIDVQCEGFIYHNGRRMNGKLGKVKCYCWALCDNPWGCFKSQEYTYKIACRHKFPDNEITAANPVSDCYT